MTLARVVHLSGLLPGLGEIQLERICLAVQRYGMVVVGHWLNKLVVSLVRKAPPRRNKGVVCLKTASITAPHFPLHSVALQADGSGLTSVAHCCF